MRTLLLFAVIGAVMTLFTCSTCRGSIDSFLRVWFLTSCMWMFLWKGNEYLAEYLSIKISWINNPGKRLIAGLITTVAYTALVVYALMKFYNYLFGLNFGAVSYMMYASFGITITISLIMHSIAFFKHWRQASVNAEKFQKESVMAKYESLKSQVNPHFLFNSLNVLTNLVYDDQDKAVKFIKQLSEVYRYVLDTRDHEVMPLEEELKFLRSYLYLQEIRFGCKLSVDIQLNGTPTMVAPLALQMLIENAIKHNIVSEENPLNIRVSREEDYIVVENDLQRKTTASWGSSGVGLENIRQRYEYLSDKKVIVEESASVFSVRLPLIDIQKGDQPVNLSVSKGRQHLSDNAGVC